MRDNYNSDNEELKTFRKHLGFATITPTRSDRPEFLSFCKHQLERMNTKPDKSYFIDYEPKDGQVDLIPRIKEGIKQAQSDGFDLVFVVEDDDYVPANYFDNIDFNASFIGTPYTTYYNLRNNTWQEMGHTFRSSLFTTGFRISALEGFRWPKDTEKFLDIKLWQYAMGTHIKRISWRGTEAIGIKHGVGLCGGKGHVMTMMNHDKDRSWLKSKVDKEAFIFYQSLNFYEKELR